MAYRRDALYAYTAVMTKDSAVTSPAGMNLPDASQRWRIAKHSTAASHGEATHEAAPAAEGAAAATPAAEAKH